MLVSLMCINIKNQIYKYTVIYRLIATATIIFSKRKDAATKRWWPLNLCRVSSRGVYTVPMFQM